MGGPEGWEHTAWWEDTMWRQLSDEEKLRQLSGLMVDSHYDWAEEQFGILLKTMPVDLVSMHLLVTLGRWTDLRSTTKKKHFKMF